MSDEYVNHQLKQYEMCDLRTTQKLKIALLNGDPENWVKPNPVKIGHNS